MYNLDVFCLRCSLKCPRPRRTWWRGCGRGSWPPGCPSGPWWSSRRHYPGSLSRNPHSWGGSVLYFLTIAHHTHLYSPAITQILVPLTARLAAHLRLATGVSRLRPSLSSEPSRPETKIVLWMTGAEITSESWSKQGLRWWDLIWADWENQPFVTLAPSHIKIKESVRRVFFLMMSKEQSKQFVHENIQVYKSYH